MAKERVLEIVSRRRIKANDRMCGPCEWRNRPYYQCVLFSASLDRKVSGYLRCPACLEAEERGKG
jgi:hypothetical protein